jgi:hypothetical protein
MKKIAVVLFVLSAALAGCHHKKASTAPDTGGATGSAAGSAAGSGDMGSGAGGAGSGSAM